MQIDKQERESHAAANGIEADADNDLPRLRVEQRKKFSKEHLSQKLLGLFHDLWLVRHTE